MIGKKVMWVGGVKRQIEEDGGGRNGCKGMGGGSERKGGGRKKTQ